MSTFNIVNDTYQASGLSVGYLLQYNSGAAYTPPTGIVPPGVYPFPFTLYGNYGPFSSVNSVFFPTRDEGLAVSAGKSDAKDPTILYLKTFNSETEQYGTGFGTGTWTARPPHRAAEASP